MGDLVLFDPNPDPSLVLLRAFHQHMHTGDPPNDAMASYTAAKQEHPNEFAIVSTRARAHGHQHGVPRDRYRHRQEIVLKGHHNHLINGVCIGVTGAATCVVARYPTHNFPVIVPIRLRVGGSGGRIKDAFRVNQRILEDQQLTAYNFALFEALHTRNPVRLYGTTATGWYVYMGLYVVTGGHELDTPQGFNCFEFIFDFVAENMPGPFVEFPPGPFVQFPPDEDEEEEDEEEDDEEEEPLLAWPGEPLLLEWHGDESSQQHDQLPQQQLQQAVFRNTMDCGYFHERRKKKRKQHPSSGPASASSANQLAVLWNTDTLQTESTPKTDYDYFYERRKKKRLASDFISRDSVFSQVASRHKVKSFKDLEEAKSKSDRLAKELAHLKSSFWCENIVSTDKIGTKEVRCRGNGLDWPAKSDHKSAVTHEAYYGIVVKRWENIFLHLRTSVIFIWTFSAV